MFVPFDKIYEFLDHCCHDDTVIYVFDPPGSKKPTDLNFLNLQQVRKHNNYFDLMHDVHIIMHDQEPLNWELYQDLDPDEIADHLKAMDYINFQQGRYPHTYVQWICQKNLAYIMSTRTICDRHMICHSELNSPELAKYENNGFVGVYWWSHAIIARDWYRYAAIDPELDFSSASFDRDFNVYNRAWSGTREYRLKFVDLILQDQLQHRCKITFNPWDEGCHYQNHQFTNLDFKPLHDLEVLPPNTASASSSADYSFKDYQDCAIDVVLETLFDDPRLHLTEKTLRPIACGKPFLLVSQANSLEYLRSYGFRTFHDVIDESYDRIVEPLERLHAVIDLMAWVSRLSFNKKQKLFSDMHAIAEHNKRYFWSQDFVDKVIDEFKVNYEKAYVICKNSMTGQDWIDYRKFTLANDYRDRWEEKLMITSNSKRSREDVCRLMLEVQRTRRLKQQIVR